MPDAREPVPDWDNSDNWDEFQWEAALKYSDRLAARYFRMLERFGDLPDADELIAQRLGDSTLNELDEADFYTTTTLDNWQADFWNDEDDEDDDPPLDPGERGDEAALYYESCPVYQRAQRLALGWCNIEASVIRAEDRLWGMNVLFYFGRLLSCIALSIGDGSFDRLPARIAFAKRGLQQINMILGDIDDSNPHYRRYPGTLRHIRGLLLEIHDMMIDYLHDLRAQGGEEIDGE